MAKQTFTTGQVLTAAQMTSLQQTAMGGGSTTAKTASYVLVAADAGTVVQMNAAGATTITVNTALFAAGDTVQIQNVGAGVCTVTAGTATVNTSATLALKQYDAGTLYFNTTSAAFFFAVDAADAGGSPLTTKGDLYGFSTLDARIPIGTNNQVLTADSAQGLGLKWATPASGGGTTLISTTTMSGASVTLSSIPQTYTYLLLVFNEFTNNTGDGFFRIDSNGDGGIARISGLVSSGSFSSTTNILQTPATYDRTNADNGGQIQIYNYTAANNYNKAFVWTGNYYAGAVGLIAGGIMSANNGAITSIVLSNTGGTWAGGTTYFYGVK